MKKLLAIFLALTLLLSFAACNKDGNGDDNTTTSAEQTTDNGTTNKNESPSKKPNKEEKTTAEPFVDPNITVPESLFKIINVNDYLVQSRDPQTAASGLTTILKRYEPKKPMATATFDVVMVGTTEVALNKTLLRDILAEGWTLQGKVDANQAVEPGKSAVVYLKNGQNKIVKMDLTNNSANILAVTQCVVTEVNATKAVDTKYGWEDLSLKNSLDTKATYADVINILGVPYAINVNEVYRGNDYQYCTTTFIYEQKAENVTYALYVRFEDKNGTPAIDSFVVAVK